MRLTRTGRVVVAGALVSILAGVALGLVALVALGTTALAATAIAALAVIEPPLVDVARRATPTEVDRGSPAEITLAFRGMSRRRPRPFHAIETVAGEARLASMAPIGNGQVVPVTYPLDTSRRGTVQAGPLLLVRTDPFGLLIAERRIGTTCSVAVRPRRHHIRMLPSGRVRDLEGPTREQSRGSASFHQLREYVPGDDLRHIHWRSTARTGELIVKELVDTTRPELVVILDNRTVAISDTDFEAAVEIAASVLHAAETDGFPTQLLFADGSSDLGTDGLPLPAIERLTNVQRTGEDNMEQMARELRGRGRSLVFVTGELTAPELQLVRSIAVRFSPAYLVSVVAERKAPFVTPPAIVGVACRSAEEFAAEWGVLR